MNKIVCLVVLIILMSAVPFSAFAVNGSNDAPNNIDVQVNAEADDGFVARSPELFRNDSIGIMIGTDLKFSSFLRFSNVTIPENATITKASITVVPIVTNQAGPRVNISVANDANPSAPISSFDYYDRERTASSVNWNASLWHAGVSKNSTDISIVIQELVDSYDYSSGAPVLIFLDAVADGRNQCFAAYEHLHYAPAKLYIEYITEKEEEYKVHNINTGEGFSTIQAAIDDPDTKDGHMITVDPGMYTENVNVTKSSTIKSSSGNPADTIVQAANPNDHVFEVAADYVNISGFTITGGEEGISISNYGSSRIINNKILNNAQAGIYVSYANGNLFQKNIIRYSHAGILLKMSNNNRIINNTLSDTLTYGAICLNHLNTNNTIENNEIFRNERGIWFVKDFLGHPRDNVLRNNSIRNNIYGLYFDDTVNTTVYLNNFINNSRHVVGGGNIFNSSSKITYTYNGNTYTNYLGNYWDDHEEKYPDAEEIDSTGIWDTAYSINADKDNYPLTEPWEEYFAVSQPNFKITITSDKEEYSPGDTVNITSRFEFEVHATPEEPVIITNPITVTFIAPDGSVILQEDFGSTVHVTLWGGKYSIGYSFKLSEDAPEGYYDVTASSSGGKYVKTTENLFYVKAGGAEKQRPTAKIDSITPNPATQGKDTVHFKGHGEDADGYIVEYYWASSMDGRIISESGGSEEFEIPASALSVGTHTIGFRVKDNDGQWSEFDTTTITIKPKKEGGGYNFDGFPVETRAHGTVNGGVFIDYEPWAGTITLTGNFDVPNGDVKWARLYTGIWGGTEDYAGWVNVVFNGVYDINELGPIYLQGKNDVNPNVWCCGHGKYWIYYDVTDLVNAGATNTATVSKINATVGSFDGRVYGIVLVVVYEGGDNPKDIQYWINDGSDGLNYATPHNEGTTYFEGAVDTGIVNDAKLTMVHLTAYDPGCANCLKFNNNSLDTNVVDTNTFELNTWDVKSYLASSGNNAWYSRGEDPYANVCNAILVLEM